MSRDFVAALIGTAIVVFVIACAIIDTIRGVPTPVPTPEDIEYREKCRELIAHGKSCSYAEKERVAAMWSHIRHR